MAGTEHATGSVYAYRVVRIYDRCIDRGSSCGADGIRLFCCAPDCARGVAHRCDVGEHFHVGLYTVALRAGVFRQRTFRLDTQGWALEVKHGLHHVLVG